MAKAQEIRSKGEGILYHNIRICSEHLQTRTQGPMNIFLILHSDLKKLQQQLSDGVNLGQDA